MIGLILAGALCGPGYVPGWLDETGMPDWVLPAGVMLAFAGAAFAVVGARTRSGVA